MPYNTKNRYEQGQALRKEIYMHIVSYIKLVGYAPSITEISERVDAGRATVWKHINNLVDDLEKKHHIQICDDYKELIERYGA